MQNAQKKPQIFQGKVETIANVAGDYYMGRIALTTPDTITFTAGQYAVFEIGAPKHKHTLSIASAPQNNHTIEIIQGVSPGGPGSQWAKSLKAGDSVTFMAPLGWFVMDKVSLRKKVMIATGCGIAPLRSMILDYLHDGTGPATRPEIVLYWGLRYEKDIFMEQEFADLAKTYTNFSYSITLSKGGDGCKGSFGRVTDHVTKKEKDIPDSDMYICGNRDMIEEMKTLLLGAGAQKERIFTERF